MFSQDPWLMFGVPALGWVAALLCLIFGLRSGRKQWLLDNLPTSKTSGVFIGLVELKGTAEAEQPLVSHLTGTRCVYYRWQVEERWSRLVRETYTDEKGRTQTRTREESGWTTVAEGGDELPFYLKDDAGAIRIQPAGAKIEAQTVLSESCGPSHPLYYGKGPAGAIADSEHVRNFNEYAILLHAPLFVVGQAREREDVVAAEIAADKREPLFLISTRSEKQVSNGLRVTFWVLYGFGLLFAVGGLWARDGLSGVDASVSLPSLLGVVIAYIAMWLLGWAVVLYNSLIDLRERVNQGWANIDVQLKRRSELIPRLVEIVKGFSDHEKKVQTQVATLRSQMSATAPGQPGPDPSACSPSLLALAEAYPELKANNNFTALQEQLIETEQRIALARSYFNEIATFYNARLQMVPDGWVAKMGRLQSRQLLSADGFEQATVRVNFAT